MTELQQNRYDRLLRRVGGLIGAKSMVNDALGELFPTIDVENVPGELLALMGTQLGWCSTQLVASAANFNHQQLFNPAKSGVLLVVTTVTFESPTALVFRFSNFIGAQATLAGNERRRDTREGVLANLVGQQRTGQTAVSGGLDYRVTMVAGVAQTLTDSNGIAILFPGTGLTISTDKVNVDSVVSFMWRERVFEESERDPGG